MGNSHGSIDVTLPDGELDDMDDDEEEHNKKLMEVIGYLEACVPRMDELIWAGLDGDLKEETMKGCLEARDRLHVMLHHCDSPFATVSEGEEEEE